MSARKDFELFDGSFVLVILLFLLVVPVNVILMLINLNARRRSLFVLTSMLSGAYALGLIYVLIYNGHLPVITLFVLAIMAILIFVQWKWVLGKK